MDGPISTEALGDKDSLLSKVLDSIFDGVYITDRTGTILFWNRAAEEITGYTAESVAGRRCSDNMLNHIDEHGRMLCGDRCPLMQTIETGVSGQAKVYPRHRDGHRFPVQTHIGPIRNEHGEIIAGIEVFRDIGHEETFRLLQEKFNHLVKKYVSQTTYEELVVQATSGADAIASSLELTIFYLDMVGFTALSEGSEPSQVVQVLNEVFGMCDVITRENHGDIDKFIGDALLATFIDVNDAVDAARKVAKDALPCYNQKRKEKGLEAVNVRIGIHSGVVLQGDIGSSERKDRTVIGDVVNVAQRIESICAPGTFFISEAAFSRLEEAWAPRFAFHGEVQVKGRAEPVRVYAFEDKEKD